MTVKMLTQIVGGRLLPATSALDADLVEISKEIGNKILVKEDGLFYSEDSLKDEIATTYATKTSVSSVPRVTTYGATGVQTNVKIFSTVVQANSDGIWTVDYTHVGFTSIPVVTVSGTAVGTAVGDRRFASLANGQPTKTSCSGILLSSSSAGLLAAMTMVTGSGPVSVVAIGV